MDVRTLFEQLHPDTELSISKIYDSWVESNQNKTTYLIFTDVKPVIMNVAVPTCKPNETQKTFPVISCTYSERDIASNIGGSVIPRPFIDDEAFCGCFSGSPDQKLLHQADYVSGNTAIIYAVAQNDTHVIFHELGHSFGLSHTFDKPPELDKLKASKGHLDENHAKAILNHFPTYQFYQGYADNVMDCKGRITEIKDSELEDKPLQHQKVNEFLGKMNSLFKWQWNILRADRSLTIPKNKELQPTKLNFTTETVHPELCLRIGFHRGSAGSPRTETVVLFHFVECIFISVEAMVWFTIYNIICVMKQKKIRKEFIPYPTMIKWQ